MLMLINMGSSPEMGHECKAVLSRNGRHKRNASQSTNTPTFFKPTPSTVVKRQVSAAGKKSRKPAMYNVALIFIFPLSPLRELRWLGYLIGDRLCRYKLLVVVFRLLPQTRR